MALSDDIREKVAELLVYTLELPEFEDWIASETWNVHRDPDAEVAAPLAYGIELLLSELSGGYRTEDELRHSLARLLQGRWASFVVIPPNEGPSPLVFSGAGTESVKVPA